MVKEGGRKKAEFVSCSLIQIPRKKNKDAFLEQTFLPVVNTSLKDFLKPFKPKLGKF